MVTSAKLYLEVQTLVTQSCTFSAMHYTRSYNLFMLTYPCVPPGRFLRVNIAQICLRLESHVPQVGTCCTIFCTLCRLVGEIET